MAVTVRSNTERTTSLAVRSALNNATAGINHAVASLEAGKEVDIGSAAAPINNEGAVYWVDVVPGPQADSFVLTSTGTSRRQTQTLEVVVRANQGGVFNNAIFAGNSSEDPLYTLELGGVGTQKDEITGSIYSGQDVSLVDDATVSGTVRAVGSISGGTGETGTKQMIPDIAGMDYANTADFDVADMFSTDAYYNWDDAGGWAYQLDEASPAHIFRMNPSDRTSETGSTVKNDYFLEDPYEIVHPDHGQIGGDAYKISLSGTSGGPGEDGNRKVYYIDGNLWIHNKKTYSMRFANGGAGGLQATFVVSGNIYFSDNVFYNNQAQDGVAFIAMKDDAVEDSGNIYLGDPEFGTLRRMYGYMYAEEDFYDVNLDASGSAVVEIHGNMTAGDQVVIDRDHENGSHTKLLVGVDDDDLLGCPSQRGGALSQGVLASRALLVLSHLAQR